MSYPRFMVKCVFTFVVFPLVFWVPFAFSQTWELVARIRDNGYGAVILAARGLPMTDEMRLSIASYWPALIFWFLAFIVWATLTYLMWFRVPNKPRK